MKKYLCLFFLSLCSILTAENYTVIEDQANLIVKTPTLLERKVKKLHLENGLEALLISDPGTHKSGAAVAVGVGSWDDPFERPGMAHFVEHMLFLGTEKYPEEEGYNRYLHEHGGSDNAFTMADRTVYMFSVNNEGLLGALDRFGQFFISPLFNPSGVDRECRAIHQEFCKDIPLDPWRALYVRKELANEQHPFHNFSIGNQETLAKISQDELKEWYHTHYSANLMHLVVYSPLDLDLLEEEVVSIFSQVKNLDIDPVKCPETLLSSKHAGKLISIHPVQDLQLLELCWEIPRFYGQDRSMHVDKLISHVLGHEGSTSLLAQLKRENLADTLSMGTFRAGHDQCLLSMSIQLTSKGIKEYENVIERCFEAIASIRKSGIPQFIFDEVSQIEEIEYQFQSRQDVFNLVSDYAMRLIDEPLATFPRQTLIPSVYSPEKIQELITYLTPQNCHFTLVASPSLSKISPNTKEKWLGVDYKEIPIKNKKIEKWSLCNSHPDICIPRPNPFVPENLSFKTEVVDHHPYVPTPSLLGDEENGRIYVAQDDQFFVPEICWIYTIKSPQISDANPLTHVFADLYCHTVDQQLNPISYEALMAGLSYSLKPKHGALELKIKGYSDKAPEFLKTILQAMITTKPSRAHYDQYFELIRRDYVNTLNINPLKQGSELLMGILFKDFSGLGQKSVAMEKASYEKMVSFCQNLLKESHIEGMLYGNLTIEEGEEVWNMTKHILDSAPYPPHRHPKIELAYLPENSHPSYLVMKSQHPANALILTADCGEFSFKKRAAQEILTKGLEEPFFSELRTRQQTAYVVTNWSQELERHLYSFFAIQSSSHDTRDLLARFELFLESSLQHLTDNVIPNERFESIRASQIHQLKNPVENLSKMGGLLHTLAFQYDGDFEWLDKRREALEVLTYDEFVEFANAFLSQANPRRLAVCVNGALKNRGSLSYRHIMTPEKIRKQICYKSRDCQMQMSANKDH